MGCFVRSGLSVSTFGGLRNVILPVRDFCYRLRTKAHCSPTYSLYVELSVIRRAYNDVSQEECRLTKVTSHEVRAVASSAFFP